VLDDAMLRVKLPEESVCRPGFRDLLLVTPLGLCRCERAVEVRPWEAHFSAREDNGRLIATASVNTTGPLLLQA
jgi:hypothetical protein